MAPRELLPRAGPLSLPTRGRLSGLSEQIRDPAPERGGNDLGVLHAHSAYPVVRAPAPDRVPVHPCCVGESLHGHPALGKQYLHPRNHLCVHAPFSALLYLCRISRYNYGVRRVVAGLAYSRGDWRLHGQKHPQARRGQPDPRKVGRGRSARRGGQQAPRRAHRSGGQAPPDPATRQGMGQEIAPPEGPERGSPPIWSLLLERHQHHPKASTWIHDSTQSTPPSSYFVM